MPSVESSKATTVIGAGRPDYQDESWQAKTFKRIELHYGETLIPFLKTYSPIASLFNHVVPPLAIGATAYLRNGLTGADMPYTVPVDYEFEVLMLWASMNQNTRQFVEINGVLDEEHVFDSFEIYYESEVYEFQSRFIDPTFAGGWNCAFGGINIGLDVMRGYAAVYVILRARGTEVPTDKEIVCKWCGNKVRVPLATTKYICLKCGKETWYFAPVTGGEVIITPRGIKRVRG